MLSFESSEYRIGLMVIMNSTITQYYPNKSWWYIFHYQSPDGALHLQNYNKFKKNVTYMDSNISSRMAKVQFLNSFTLTFIFKINFWHFSWFANILQTVRDWANTIVIRQKVDICYRMGPLQMSMNYIFKVTNFEMRISQKHWQQRKLLWYDFYSGWDLPSSRTIANVVLHDLDLYF